MGKKKAIFSIFLYQFTNYCFFDGIESLIMEAKTIALL